MKLLDLPLQSRPRERLLNLGEHLISTQELLAILLGNGTKGKSVLQLAEELFHHFGGLMSLLDASVEELMEIRGIGKAKALQLRAVFAIALRCLHEKAPEKTPIHSARDGYAFLKHLFFQQKQEILAVLLRDVKGHAFHREIVAKGTLTEVMIHPREVFHHAVRHKAKSIIIAHNHPSGDPTPSKADIQLTHLLSSSSKIMGIDLDDHLIIGEDSFTSLREIGLIEREAVFY